MKETQFEQLVKDLKIQLYKNEEIIQVIQNKNNDQDETDSLWFKLIILGMYQFHMIWFTILFFIVVGLLIFEFYVFAVLGVAILLIASIPNWDLVDLSPERKPHTTIVTNMRVILPSKRSFNWEKVYNLKLHSNGKKRYLVLDLKPDKVDYDLTTEDLKSTVQGLNFIFIGGHYNADQLFKKIQPHWKERSPILRLERLKEELLKKHNLTIAKTSKHLSLLTRDFGDYKVSYIHRNKYPVTSFEMTVEYKHPIVCYLSISNETLGTHLKDKLGLKDIKTGNPTLDIYLRILSSHPELIKQLLDKQTSDNLRKILKHISLNFAFGKPIKQSKLGFDSIRKREKDNEEILDLQLATNNKEDIVLSHKGSSTFSINATINLYSRGEIKHIKEITHNLWAVALHFANGLNTLKE